MSTASAKDRPVYPHYLKLGRFIRNTIEQHGYTVKSFTDKFKRPANATLHQIIRAQQKSIGTDILKAIADGLSEISGEDITVRVLTELIEDAPAGFEFKAEMSEPTPAKSPDILPPSAILWHFRRLSPDDRFGLWRDLLPVLVRDLEEVEEIEPETGILEEVALGRNPKMEILIGLLNELADRHKLATVGELADYLLSSFPDANIDRAAYTAGLSTILTRKQLPPQNSPEYEILIPLADALGFDGDHSLLEYCGIYRPNGNPKGR